MANRAVVYEAACLDRRNDGAALTSSSRGPIARRGAVLVWVAVSGVLLIGLVGLAMDAGVVLLAGSHLQIAADAGSLAGARLVRNADSDIPREAALAIALENKAAGIHVRLDPNSTNLSDGDIVIGRYHRIREDHCARELCCETPPCFFPQLETPNAVKVVARRTSNSGHEPVPLVFGAAPLFDVQGIDVTRSATAMIAGSTAAGVIVLDPYSDCTLEISGNAVLDLQSAPGWDGDTSIQVNSSDSCALCGDGSSLQIHAPESNIVGSSDGYCFSGDPALDTYLNPDSPPAPDPLRDLAPPPIGPDRGEIRKSGIYPPGYYSGGVDINQGTVDLGPGIYVFGGTSNKGGLRVGARSGLNAVNVLLYIKSGKVDLSGAGSITITPMTEAVNTNPDYIGISIFQARNNPTPAQIIGNSSMNLQGTYYFPNALLEVGGTGIALGNQLIVYQLRLHGSGEFNILYDGRFPTLAGKVFLVQ